jgi:hypothetical protein
MDNFKTNSFFQISKISLIVCLLLFKYLPADAQAQLTDSTLKKAIVFSGSVGISSNGFSIVPTFSLNSPASMTLLSVRKNKFSFDPDIRLTPDAKKGSVILWFRYHAVTKKNYRLRVGAHPAMNFQAREIVVNGTTSTISQMRRFFAWEVSNDFKISKHLSAGVYYLQGNGLQKDGARTTHFVAFNTSIADMRLTNALRLTAAPTFYYLYLDKEEGTYVSGAVTLSHKKWPFTLQHAFNKTINSNITGNKDYMWNVSVHYHFKKIFRKV